MARFTTSSFCLSSFMAMPCLFFYFHDPAGELHALRQKPQDL